MKITKSQLKGIIKEVIEESKMTSKKLPLSKTSSQRKLVKESYIKKGALDEELEESTGVSKDKLIKTILDNATDLEDSFTEAKRELTESVVETLGFEDDDSWEWVDDTIDQIIQLNIDYEARIK